MSQFVCRFLILCLFGFAFPLFSETQSSECAKTVLVSIAPYKYFVNRIAGKELDVIVFVPPGANAHFYEPTPKHVMTMGCASIWFTIGEAFETRATQALKTYQPKLSLVDLRKNVDLIYDSSHAQCSHAHCADPHIWLSCPAVKQQLRTILDALSSVYPEHAAMFRLNYDALISEVNALNVQLEEMLEPLSERAFMVSHPAYSYFARDYRLEQISIEFEGKDPSPQQLTRLLQIGREKKIRNVLLQIQFSSKGARLIAEQLKANVTVLDPYEEDFFKNMRQTAQAILKP